MVTITTTVLLMTWVCVICYICWGTEDFIFDLLLFLKPLFTKVPSVISVETLRDREEQWIAVYVPAWMEAGVVNRMAEYGVRILEYKNYNIFIGVYPNDKETCDEVDEIVKHHPQIYKVVNPLPGPTSKGDCLNAIYHGMQEVEKKRGIKYSIIAIHDSEDVLHPFTLKMYNYKVPAYVDMVQLPVLPLFSCMLRGWVQNTYIDEFCEYHLKDMRVRQLIGGIVPSAGVGTGFNRVGIDRLSREKGGEPFRANSLTEDYFLGLEFSQMKMKAGFVETLLTGETRRKGRNMVCVKEFFPNTYYTSIKQRARWMIGIIFQSWEQFGWFGNAAQRYTLYRDRRSLLVNSINPFGYFVTLCLIINYCYGLMHHKATMVFSPHLRWLLGISLCFLVYRATVKAIYVGSVYGPIQGVFSVLRYPFANMINSAALIRACYLYVNHKITGKSIAWDKTTHQFPATEELNQQANGEEDLNVGVVGGKAC